MVIAAGGMPAGGERGSATVFVIGSHAAAFQVGRVSPGLRLVHEAFWCGPQDGPTACKVMQPGCGEISPDPRRSKHFNERERR